MSGGVMALLAIAVVIIIAITVMSAAAERERARALRVWAGGRGWGYARERPELADRFAGAPFRRAPSNARAVHVLWGEHRGHRVLAYEYTYITCGQDGRSAPTTHRFPVVAVPTPPTPLLGVRADTGRALSESRGGNEVRVGEPGFDEVFEVRCQDEAFARVLLDERVRTWLLGDPGGRAPFRFTGGHLLAWGEGGMEPEVVMAMVDPLIDLLELAPAGVWEGARG
ncbi:hypothetical protein [Nocardiopsis sp. JB363]|uniref:hypothetical protein n=1 Tax=Nocardiopsis sp. JB363 TaxID=1434837 RepID=UPI00097A7A1D|nr:hypothetical protein [Nocardiopsis sp. JB363]SIO89922.1 hypothetical protein BQ8420_24065 [Nocardiopsis sp. JB363]